MDKSTKEKIDAFWSNHSNGTRMAWWHSAHIIRHVNKLICGEPLEGWNAGALKLVQQRFPAKFGEALSIGSGTATKEISLVEKNIVSHFDIYELSSQRIATARETVQQKGLNEHFSFYNDDYFSSDSNKKYDLIFFDNSLHHMFDVDAAVKTTYANLKVGGCFFCNDFVGASRFQWSDLELFVVNGIRSQLPDEVFRYGDKYILPRYIQRPSLKHMMETDPSEAADSDSIIPAVEKYLDNPTIIHTGGLVYHLCCGRILMNIPDNSILLRQLLCYDMETIQHGFRHYAFILAKKA